MAAGKLACRWRTTADTMVQTCQHRKASKCRHEPSHTTICCHPYEDVTGLLGKAGWPSGCTPFGGQPQLACLQPGVWMYAVMASLPVSRCALASALWISLDCNRTGVAAVAPLSNSPRKQFEPRLTLRWPLPAASTRVPNIMVGLLPHPTAPSCIPAYSRSVVRCRGMQAGSP